MIFFANTRDGGKPINHGDKVHIDVAMSAEKSRRCVILTFGGEADSKQGIGFDEVLSVSFSYDEFSSFVEKVNDMKETCEYAKTTTEHYDARNCDDK